MTVRQIGPGKDVSGRGEACTKTLRVRDCSIVMPHGDCQGLRLERQKGLEGASLGSLGKDSGLKSGFMEPPKGFKCTQEED